MRIIAGRLGGRNFVSPHGNKTHPMSDKIRGALFNALGDIEGLSVLDAFAGTGGLCFEAVSRGASSVTAIDNDTAAQRAISDNIKTLGLQRSVKLIKAAAGSWLDTSDGKFDIVILDPPFDQLQPLLLVDLADRVTVNGVVVLSLPPDARFRLSADYSQLLTKNYGDAKLVFYRRIK